MENNDRLENTIRVFISWSGERSRRLGQAFRDWLPQTLQVVKPYFTPSDTEKGAKWDNEITQQLEGTNFCIITLTPESLNSRWVMFEAGAISKVVDKARICPVVFGLEPTDIEGPLARFQATRFNQTEMHQLIANMNAATKEAALKESVLNAVFCKWWPELDSEVQNILKVPIASSAKPRDETSLLTETLTLARQIAAEQDDMRNLLSQLIRSQSAPPTSAFSLSRGIPTGPTDINTISTSNYPAGLSNSAVGLGGIHTPFNRST